MQAEDQSKYNSRAEEHVKKAQQKLKGGVLKNLFTSKNERIDEGLDHYRKALDNYKLAKNWFECAMINIECSKLTEAQKDLKETADFLAEAGNYFLKANEVEEGVKAYKEAVNIYKENGSFENVSLKVSKLFEEDRRVL